MKIVVVGAGHWGKNLVRNFHELGELAGVCDPQAVAVPDDVRFYGSVAEVLQNTSDDIALVIATPAETHYRLAKQVLEAGRDVFVEKPLALALSEAQELVDLAQERQRILMVGHVLEYHPAIIRLVELVRDKRLGKLQYIYSNRLSFGKLRREENVMWSFAPHDVAVICRLVGLQDDVSQVQVSAFSSSYASPLEDTTLMALRFDQVSAHIHVSWIHPYKEQCLVVVGSRAMAVFDDVKKSLSIHHKYVDADCSLVSEESESVSYSDDEPLRCECRAFLESVRTRRSPLTDGRSALRVIDILERAQRTK